MKLNHYIAQAGITSRRKAAELIKEGRVKVNGKVIKEPFYETKSTDHVRVNGKLIKLEKKKRYILLNKPPGCVTTVADERGRKTVLDILSKSIKERIYPVGRLDYNTTGLLLLTNDGELAHKLSHPRSEIKKIYHVKLDRPIPDSIIERIKKGMRLSDGVVHIDSIRYWADRYKNQLKIVLHSGKYRIIRRLFEHLGYTIKSLNRISYAGLTTKGLGKGRWRSLSTKEVGNLKRMVGLKMDERAGK